MSLKRAIGKISSVPTDSLESEDSSNVKQSKIVRQESNFQYITPKMAKHTQSTKNRFLYEGVVLHKLCIMGLITRVNVVADNESKLLIDFDMVHAEDKECKYVLTCHIYKNELEGKNMSEMDITEGLLVSCIGTLSKSNNKTVFLIKNIKKVEFVEEKEVFDLQVIRCENYRKRQDGHTNTLFSQARKTNTSTIVDVNGSNSGNSNTQTNALDESTNLGKVLTIIKENNDRGVNLNGLVCSEILEVAKVKYPESELTAEFCASLLQKAEDDGLVYTTTEEGRYNIV